MKKITIPSPKMMFILILARIARIDKVCENEEFFYIWHGKHRGWRTCEIKIPKCEKCEHQLIIHFYGKNMAKVRCTWGQSGDDIIKPMGKKKYYQWKWDGYSPPQCPRRKEITAYPVNP